MSDPALLSANRPLFDWLKAQAKPGNGGLYEEDGWELHTHPDLGERLLHLGPPDTFRHLYGIGTLVHPAGVIFAFAAGMSDVSFWEGAGAVPDGVRTSERRLLPGWLSVEAWPVDLSMKLGTEVMTRFVSGLYAFVS